MEKYLRDVMSDNKNGLYLCELPTGFGKTFTSVKLISEWIKENHSGRKIIFLTTLNKNLPEDELRDALGDAVYRQTVLRIRSNFDEVVEKLPELEISEQFQTESYQRLLQSIKQYIRAIRYEAGDRKYIIELENRVREAETGFRSMLTDHLRKVFPSKNARMEAIRHHADYRWMGKLYPAVFTDDYRVLMMSVNKFLTKNSVLTEPSYDFLKAPFIQNAIIFIDEFDATKATVKSEIIERSLGMKNDFLVLFRQLNRMLNTQHLSRKMRDSYAKIEEDKKARYTFSNLIKEADEIDEKYHTRLSYKTVESAIDRRQNFLLKDTSFHTVLQGGAKYIRAQVNRQQNVVDICFEDRKQHLANKQPDDIVIYSLIRDINRFLRHFKVFLFEWARHYCGLENNRRDSGRDRMTFENAVASIMDKLELSVPQRKLLMGELCEPLIWLKDEDIIPHVSFYQDGMEIFEFEDNDAHNDSTAINFVKVYDTPEKLLIYLARQSKVIGISATAEIPTVVGNYHLHYVEEVLGNRFHATPPEVKERIRRELEENNRAYQDGRISIYSKIVSTDYDGKEIDEICREITGETDIADMCAQLITNQSVDRYQSVRYCNAFRAMAAFFKQSTIQSMLYLGMALPKQNHPDFDKELMKKLMKLAAALCGCDTKKDYLVVLTGDNFDSQKEQLTSRLSNGEKLFIMSSYSTLGAGQNLQYEVTNPKDYIYLRPCGNPSDKRFLTRDIDAVYLGDTTNLTTNTYSEKQMKEKLLADYNVNISDCVDSEESRDVISQLVHVLWDTYQAEAQIGNLQKGLLNLRIIHNESYYGEHEEMHDPHEDDVRGFIVQHVTVEDFVSKKTGEISKHGFEKILQELLIKADNQQKKMRAFAWNELKLSNTYSFVTRRSDKDDEGNKVYVYYQVKVQPDGSLGYKCFNEKDDVYTEEQENIINAFEQLEKELFRHGSEIECLIDDGMGNHHAIGKTKEFTRPDTSALHDALYQTQPKTAVPKVEFIRYLDEFIATHEEQKEAAVELKKQVQKYDGILTKQIVHKMMNLKSGAYVILNRWLHTEHDLWIYSEFKSADSGIEMKNLEKIQYYPDKWDDNSFYYFVGSKNGAKESVSRACTIRRVTSAKETLSPDFLFSMLAVDFVRNGQYTVIPFPLKYLREYFAL